MAHDVLRLGEGCLTNAQFSHKFQWQLLPNRCYLLGGLSVGTKMKNEMRYRIKVTTFQNGRKEYVAQVKKMFGWVNLNYDGEATIHTSGVCDERERALQRIDKHFEGNTSVQKIEFEYVNK